MSSDSLIAFFLRIIRPEQSWVLFSHGTCVLLETGQKDLATAASAFLGEWGVVEAGSERADFNCFDSPVGRGWLVTFYREEMLTYVDPADVAAGHDEEIQVGMAALWQRDQDAAERQVIHVQPAQMRGKPGAYRAGVVRCAFLRYSQRDNVPADSVVYDVSSYADDPYCRLSPMWPHGGIPVPGMDGTTADSVEGIWQGLKVIRGRTAPRLFSGSGHERGGGKPAGHQYGRKLLGIIAARFKIYKVAYEWMLDHRIDPNLIGQFTDRARRGLPQYFHDVGDNGDINNARQPLAHASLLVQYVNRRLGGHADPPAMPG